MRAHPLAWLPPFLVGWSGVVASEVAMGLLLYSGTGFLRALTLILATLLTALTLGLWTAPGPDRPGLVEALRRRWLLVLVAFVAAGATAFSWEILGGFASAAATRGLGLALLAGLPLYAVGGVLGGMAAARGPGEGRVAVFAGLGGAVGALFTGLVLVPALIPVTALVLCVVLLSGGALVEGQVLDRRPERRVVDRDASTAGAVRVVDEERGEPAYTRRLLEVAGRTVGGTEDGGPLRGWEGAALELLAEAGKEGAEGAADGEEPGTGAGPGAGWILVLGATAPGLVAALRSRGHRVEVVEADPSVRRMVARHFGIPLHDEDVEVVHGTPEAVLSERGRRYTAAVVDPWSRGRPGGVATLGHVTARALAARLEPGAPLLLGVDDGSLVEAEEIRAALGEDLAASGLLGATLYHPGPGAEADGSPEWALVVAGGTRHPDRLGGAPGETLSPVSPGAGTGAGDADPGGRSLPAPGPVPREVEASS